MATQGVARASMDRSRDTTSVNDSAMTRGQASGESAAIWLRRGNESAAAYSAFAVYREQTPPRSIRKAARALGRGQRTLEEWSSKYKWVERAARYTDHLDQLVLVAHEADIVRRRREENEQVFQLARALRGLVRARILGVVDEEGKLLVSPLDPNVLTPRDVVRFFESSNKEIRRALGLPVDPDRTFQVSSKDFEAVLRAVMDLAEKRMEPEAFAGFVRDCRAVLAKQFGH